jgi:hypothetical protein
MKYINILLIILLIIVISYILIIHFTNKYIKEEFTLHDDADITDIPYSEKTKILNYDDTIKFDKIIYDDNYDECDYKYCNFLYTDIIKGRDNNKSIYITESNEIYLNLNKNYVKTKLPIYENYRITAITHKNNYEKIFVAVRLLDSERNSIYYYSNNRWFKIDLTNLNESINNKLNSYKDQSDTSITQNKKNRIQTWLKNLEDKIENPIQGDSDSKEDLEEQKKIILQEKHTIITSLDYDNINNKLIYSTYGFNRKVEYDEDKSDTIIITDLKIIEVDIENLFVDNKDIPQKIIYYYLDIGTEDKDNVITKNVIKTEINNDILVFLVTTNNNSVVTNELYFTEIVNNNGEIEYNTNIIEISENQIIENIKNVKIIEGTHKLIITDSSEKKIIILTNITINDEYNGNAIFDNALGKKGSFNKMPIKIFVNFGDQELEYIKDYYIFTDNIVYILSNGNNIYKFDSSSFTRTEIDIPKEKIIDISKLTVLKEDQIIIHSNKRIPFFYYDTNSKKVNIIYIDDNVNYDNIDKFDLNGNISFYKYYNDVLFKYYLTQETNKLVLKGKDNFNLSYYIILDEDKYVDLLAVGGGGGGGYGGGGGGAGDIKMYKNLKMPKGNYKITVGGGGKGGVDNNNKEVNWQDGKDLNMGGNGNNTIIEKIDYPDNFKKIVVVGGGGGGSDFTNTKIVEMVDGYKKVSYNHSKNALRTPIYGQIGKIEFSSGGGGGASGMHQIENMYTSGSPGQNNDETASMIGGHGNNISGNGGSSSIMNSQLYSGGGGGGGPILDRKEYKYFEVAKDLKHGETPINETLALGGDGVELEDIYELPDDVHKFSQGGRGGFIGEITSYNIILYKNKFQKTEDLGIGYGGNGGVIILNNTLNNNESIQGNNGDNGMSGIVIIYESEKLETESRVSPVVDPLLEQYRYSEENIEKRQREVEEIYQKYIEDSLNSKKMTEMTFVKYDNKNNVNQIAEEAAKINMEIALENQRNYREPINDIVRDTYLPYSTLEYGGNKDISEVGGNVDMNSPENNNKKYAIIRLFKDLLYRNPTSRELNTYFRKIVNTQLDLKKLRNLIINSEEYRKVVNLQSNNANSDVVYSNAKVNTVNQISALYFEELDEEIPKTLISPLKDIYVYFQFNDYLFRALITNQRYSDFKSHILDSKDLKQSDIIDLLEQYYDMVELRDKANNILRYDKYHKRINTNEVSDTSSFTNKYDAFVEDTDATEDELKNSLDDIILKDNYNYRLWGTQTETDTYDELEDKYEELQQMRQNLINSQNLSPQLQELDELKKTLSYDGWEEAVREAERKHMFAPSEFNAFLQEIKNNQAKIEGFSNMPKKKIGNFSNYEPRYKYYEQFRNLI